MSKGRTNNFYSWYAELATKFEKQNVIIENQQRQII